MIPKTKAFLNKHHKLIIWSMKHIHLRRSYRSFKKRFTDWFFYYLIPDAWEIRFRFKKKVGYPCHLKTPRSFNEKIQWIKLHDRNPLYQKLTDKLLVKEFVSRKIGSEYVIPTLAGGFSNFDDIPFDEVPNQFVLKCNHDSKSTIVCKDKNNFDFQEAKLKLEKALNRDYYHYNGKPWICKDIQRCIFVEKYMEEKDGQLRDYKFFVFNGECKVVFYFEGRFNELRSNCYDKDWNLLPVIWGKRKNTDYAVPKPANFDEMLAIATKLAALVNNAFVRVDLYDIEGKIYFGEYTFYPGGGFDTFEPIEWDFAFGNWIDLKQ